MEIGVLEPILTHPFVIIFSVFSIDFIFGDPVYKLHPVRLIGNLIIQSEKRLRKIGLDGRFGGFLLFVILWIVVFGSFAFIDSLLEKIHWGLALIWRLYMGFSMFAFRDLIIHAKRIREATRAKQLDKARFHVSMFAGRDTDKMDEKACNRVAIESLSESLVDSVIASLLYFTLFGFFGLITFKIISTMDSMIGYKNEKYIRFGWFGARMDDLLNYLPARLTWLMMTTIATLLPGISGRKAYQFGLKQHHEVPGPNAGWTECAAAGALEIKLIGPIWKEGKLVTDIWLGDPTDPEGANTTHITKMIWIAYATSFLFLSLIYGILFWSDHQLWTFNETIYSFIRSLILF